MSDSSNLAGLFGTVVGFVILAEGIRLIRSGERRYYRKRGYKIHSLSKLPKKKKMQTRSVIDNIRIKMPRI